MKPKLTILFIIYFMSCLSNVSGQNIAIFEEVAKSGDVLYKQPIDGSLTKRQLNRIIVESNFVNLKNGIITFKQKGTYLITASAPAFQVTNHRLLLMDEKTNEPILFGSSEYTGIPGAQKKTGIQTRSFINGIIGAEKDQSFILSHYIRNNAGDEFSLGYPANNRDLPEVYAQITIQKLSGSNTR